MDSKVEHISARFHLEMVQNDCISHASLSVDLNLIVGSVDEKDRRFGSFLLYSFLFSEAPDFVLGWEFFWENKMMVSWWKFLGPYDRLNILDSEDDACQCLVNGIRVGDSFSFSWEVNPILAAKMWRHVGVIILRSC